MDKLQCSFEIDTSLPILYCAASIKKSITDPGNGTRSGNHHHVSHVAGSILGSARGACCTKLLVVLLMNMSYMSSVPVWKVTDGPD